MKSYLILAVVALLLFGAMSAFAEGEAEVDKYQLWIGGAYTDTADYAKKVGEYNLVQEAGQFLPEFDFSYFGLRDNGTFFLNAGYTNYQNYNGQIVATSGDKLKANFAIRSTSHQLQQDLMENLETREYLPTTDSPSGKMLTHEFQDVTDDYGYRRTEILSRVSYLLDREKGLKLNVAHKAIMKKGHEQSISSNHCFSCHATSKTQKVDDISQQIEAGIEGQHKQFEYGYQFGYRYYKSEAPTQSAYYDNAEHPALGTNDEEFGSRVAFEDVTLPYNQKPTTEKMSHKIRLAGDLGKTKFAGNLTYSRSENKGTQLASSTWFGVMNITVPIDYKTRFIGRLKGQRTKSDEYFVDVPLYREGRPGLQVNFDFMRFSYLDRADGEVSAELIHRLNKKITLSGLAGFNRIDRYNYPSQDDNLVTNQFYIQGKLNYRKGLKYRTTLKARYEKTSDPFVSTRGLFEENGSLVLDGLPGAPSDLVFYFQREDIRYQNVTSEPTDLFEVDWKSTWQPMNNTTVNLGAKFVMDKNSDLDSVDVDHTKIQPHLAVTAMPDPKWSLTLGATHYYAKATVPAAVALFDG